MTAVNENGQVYCTFEDIDFDGALKDLTEKIVTKLDCQSHFNYGSRLYNEFSNEVDVLIKIALYIERLKRGMNYV